MISLVDVALILRCGSMRETSLWLAWNRPSCWSDFTSFAMFKSLIYATASEWMLWISTLVLLQFCGPFSGHAIMQVVHFEQAPYPKEISISSLSNTTSFMKSASWTHLPCMAQETARHFKGILNSTEMEVSCWNEWFEASQVWPVKTIHRSESSHFIAHHKFTFACCKLLNQDGFGLTWITATTWGLHD